jgi:dimethylhistidine N-methyltransferase
MLQEFSPRRATKFDLDQEFLSEVIAGLSTPQKTLPCRYFYDDRGSDLFELITELPEYYLTRSEAALLSGNARELMQGLSSKSTMLELGAGSSKKLEPLLRHAPIGLTFVPMDVSRHALIGAGERIAAQFPNLTVRPIVDDFTKPVGRPEGGWENVRAFFLGSTIGNFEPDAAIDLLKRWRRFLGPGAQLILGADILKDEETLLAAYNDAAGATKAFNLNILSRINRELGANFDLATFRHIAIFNAMQSRIEMHLVSIVSQVVCISGRNISFVTGESIHTENSYKHSRVAFEKIVDAAGWQIDRSWSDGLFSLYRLQ